MVEALKLMESTTKLDVKNIYESRIVADMKKERPDDVAQIEEQLEKENRLKKCQRTLLSNHLKNRNRCFRKKIENDRRFALSFRFF